MAKKAIVTGLKGGVDTLLKGLHCAVKQQAGSDLVGAAPIGIGLTAPSYSSSFDHAAIFDADNGRLGRSDRVGIIAVHRWPFLVERRLRVSSTCAQHAWRVTETEATLGRFPSQELYAQFQSFFECDGFVQRIDVATWMHDSAGGLVFRSNLRNELCATVRLLSR